MGSSSGIGEGELLEGGWLVVPIAKPAKTLKTRHFSSSITCFFPAGIFGGIDWDSRSYIPCPFEGIPTEIVPSLETRSSVEVKAFFWASWASFEQSSSRSQNCLIKFWYRGKTQIFFIDHLSTPFHQIIQRQVLSSAYDSKLQWKCSQRVQNFLF